MLHFGAVNYRARVWVNGRFAFEHRGGHSPFRSTSRATWKARGLEIVVQAEDDPLDMHKARGKMDWEPEPHKIWYPRTAASGARCGSRRCRAPT
jgi:hypothetical protein